MAEIWKGAPAAAALTERTAEKTAALRARGIVPTLAILRVGERADDLAYERGAMKRCSAAGVDVCSLRLPADTTTAALLESIRRLNADGGVHGVLMFRPLPKHLDEKAACAALAPEKDVDGVTAASMATVYSGAGAGYPPCTARACVELLKYYGVTLAGARVAVVGRSLVVGRPAALLLLRENATVTLCHTKTADLPAATRAADIVIAAAGKAGAVTGAHLCPGQIVVDVGVNAAPDGGLCGDVLFDEAAAIVRAVTPVPGGVGAVTTAVLAAQTADAAERAAP